MKDNGKQLKQYLAIYKTPIPQPLNYRRNILYANNNNINTETTKELRRYNYNSIPGNILQHIFPLSLKTCYSNAMSKFSVLIGLYQFLILQLKCAGETSSSDGGNGQSDGAAGSAGQSDVTLLGNPMQFFKKRISCVFSGSDPKCIQMTFVLLSLVGTLLSVVGAIFSLLYRFCACFFCCRRSPRPGSTNHANNNNKQLELLQMQMQMQQQQMCNALMGTAMAKRGSARNGNKKGGNNKKNKKSSNRTNKPGNRNSKNKALHIGYHKSKE
ncbi:hypothetical protein POVCU2_0055730 [Plasmodium ovale curtisi]|uniref:PIR Superfamily Protein n=1 Tax=Plasmodium ovale curtisi TaxID=864141 RepID=A0A1A8WEE5_PLAOA|nr:hypothetical protein POVCU2_0055730 [Plasmodium ovale curtisi]SBS98782.1 hypothetical protein POVCU1_048720 [Plasmodium ovale curtisi]